MMVCTADLTITNVSTETIELPIHAVFVGTAPGSIPGRWQIDMPEASGQRENGAVSYTHLRAHETVLELVCRLLLEKKKPPPPPPLPV